MITKDSSLVTAMSMQMKVEVYSYENDGSMRGTLHSRYLEEPYEFYSLMQMMGKMEKIFDEKKFPEVFMSPRTFGTVKPTDEKREAMRVDVMKKQGNQESANSKVTFVINVQFRQNATWQGNILWVEENKKQNFRSVLEMIRLMDEALLESSEDEKPVGWGKD